MWSSRKSPTFRLSDYYRPAPSQPHPLKSSGRFDQVDAGGFYAIDSSMAAEPENLEETLEEIAELEGELSSDDEASMAEGGGELRFSNGIKTAVSIATNVPFEGINFAQLFSASNAHSEKLIALAKQFYPVSLRGMIYFVFPIHSWFWYKTVLGENVVFLRNFNLIWVD